MDCDRHAPVIHGYGGRRFPSFVPRSGFFIKIPDESESTNKANTASLSLLAIVCDNSQCARMWAEAQAAPSNTRRRKNVSHARIVWDFWEIGAIQKEKDREKINTHPCKQWPHHFQLLCHIVNCFPYREVRSRAHDEWVPSAQFFFSIRLTRT